MNCEPGERPVTISLISGPGTSHIEQVPLGLLDVLKLPVIRYGLDPEPGGVKRTSSQAMTATARNSRPLVRCMTPTRRPPSARTLEQCYLDGLAVPAACSNSVAGASQGTSLVQHKNANLLRRIGAVGPRHRSMMEAPTRFGHSAAASSAFTTNSRHRAVEHRDRAFAFLLAARRRRRQTLPVIDPRPPRDLVRSAVIHLERGPTDPRTPTPRAFHENGGWKMRWPRSPAKNKRSGAPGAMGQEAQLRHAEVLGFIDDDMGERLMAR